MSLTATRSYHQKRMHFFWALSILILMAILAYSNSINNEFVYDDHAYVKNNPHIRSFSYIPSYFTRLYTYQGLGAEGQFKVYRPLVTLTFAIDYALWGLNPAGYHLTNTLLHIVAAILVYLFIVNFSNCFLVSMITSIVFLIHPIQIEAVSWISGRGNMLFSIFLLMSFIWILKLIQTRQLNYLIPIAISYTLALLAKEMAVSGLFLVFFIGLFKSKQPSIKLFMLLMLMLLIITILYISVRCAVIGKISQVSYWGGSPWITSITMVFVLVKYLYSLILPLNLNVLIDVKLIRSLFDPRFIASLLLLFFIILMGFRARKYKYVAFSLGWILCSLVPVLNIIPLRALFAERFMYLGMIGVGFLIGSFVCSIQRRWGCIIVCALFLVFCTLDVARNADWKDDLTLWNSVLRIDPNNAKAYNGVGTELMELGQFDDAISSFQTALSYDPDNVFYLNNLAFAYVQKGEGDKVKVLLEQALQSDGYKAVVYHNLGLYYMEHQKPEQALKYLNAAIAADSRYANAYNSLGICLAQSGNKEAAVHAWTTAARLNTDWPEPYYNLIVCYLNSGELTKARIALEQARTLFPGEQSFIDIQQTLNFYTE